MDLKSHFQKTYWAHLVVLLLGCWLLSAPFTFGYEGPVTPSVTGIGLKDPVAILASGHHMMVSDVVTGLIVLILGILSLNWRRNWPSWLLALVGIWLQFAPLLFWTPLPAAYLSDSLVGMFLITFAILVPKLPYEGWSSDRVIPAGWSYNPSSWLQRLPVIFFGFLGWFISRYLAAYQLGFTPMVWDPFFGEGTMNVVTSQLSRSFPISDAGLGAIAYGLEALMGCKGGPGRWRTMPWMVLLFGLLVVPLGLVSILLVMSQPIIVGFWCGLCLITAGGMLIMLALTVDEVVAVIQFMRTTDKPFIQAFWQGGEQEGATVDKRTPAFVDAQGRFKAMITGVTVPWNLLVTAAIGVWTLFAPDFIPVSKEAADNLHIFGALVVVFSVIAFAEVTRMLRFVVTLLGIWLIITSWLSADYINMSASVLLLLFSLRKGPIKETYGSWTIL